MLAPHFTVGAFPTAKGEKGVPLTTNITYGYKKDPDNPKHWIIDEEAAMVVRRIFDMCMEGRGPSQIANQLTAEKVLNPTAYKSSGKRKQSIEIEYDIIGFIPLNELVQKKTA